MTCGIYEITHSQKGRRYVGSSANIENRWSTHLSTLKAGRHHCGFLQRAWNKYGEAAFSFRILEECRTTLLAEREQHYMDLTPRGKLMNSQPNARTCRGYKHSPETIRRMSEAAQKRNSKPEYKKMISERAKAQHASGSLGSFKLESRLKMSEGLKRAWADGKFESAVEATRERMKTTSSEEMSRRSYQRKMFQETEETC